MAFNGNGVYVRPYNWQNDKAANIKIRADRMDGQDDDFATALSTCVTKDGQTTVTNDLPMAAHKHTGVSNATSRDHYAAYGQVQDGKINWAVAGGIADALTATYAVTGVAPVDGQLYFVRATAANATTMPTFAPDGNIARPIVKQGGQALAVGDIAGAGHELVLRYNLANTRYELLDPAVTSLPTGTSGHTLGYLDTSNTTSGNNTHSGTETFTNTVTQSTSAVASVTQNRTTTPGIVQQIGEWITTALNAASAAKTFVSVRNYADVVTASAEQGRHQVQVISAGTLTTEFSAGNGFYTAANTAMGVGTVNATSYYKAGVLLPMQSYFESPEISIVSNTNNQTAHVLGARPKSLEAVLRCKTAELGFSVDDEIPFPLQRSNNNDGFHIACNATNVYAIMGTSLTANGIGIIRLDTRAPANITPGNWRVVLRAWL